jgi:DNA-directed RNA polymerase specialized sigma24 family protein
MENLTEKVLLYRKTPEGLATLVKEIAPRVYQFPRRTMGWDEDACGDFYLFFHPRLLRLLNRFRDQGRPFESYLCAILNWQLRNFARERKQGERSWSASLRLDPGEGFTGSDSDPEEGGPPRFPPAGLCALVRSDADRKNFLYLLLKCCRDIDPCKVDPLAAVAGVTPERFRELATTLKAMRSSREKRLETFRERRNRAFALARLLESEAAVEPDGERRDALRSSIARARRRMASAMERMARVGIAPTNREIAIVLGVPKGTVDSGLYWLKRKLAPVYDPDCPRSA